MNAIRPVSADPSHATQAGQFLGLARCLAAARGRLAQAHALAEERRLPTSVVEVLRSAVAAGTLTNSSAIAGYPALATAFLESLRSVCAFDRMLPDMRRVPLRTRISVVTAGLIGSTPAEASAKIFSSLSLAATTLEPEKATALVVISDEVLRAGGTVVDLLFNAELRAAVAAATDALFVDILTSGITPIVSSGSTATAAWADLSHAVRALNTSAASKVYLLTTAKITKNLALALNDDGTFLFPDLTISGGTIAGVTVLASDGVLDGTMIFVDASQIIAGSDTIVLDTSRTADVQLETPTDSPPTASTVLQGLWQRGLVALRAERWFGVERPRAGSVSIVEGISYGNSP